MLRPCWSNCSPRVSGSIRGPGFRTPDRTPGKLSITVNETGDGDLTFYYQDQAIKPKKVTAKIVGNEVEFVFAIWNWMGFKLKTTFSRDPGWEEYVRASISRPAPKMESALDSGTWKAALRSSVRRAAGTGFDAVPGADRGGGAASTGLGGGRRTFGICSRLQRCFQRMAILEG